MRRRTIATLVRAITLPATPLAWLAAYAGDARRLVVVVLLLPQRL